MLAKSEEELADLPHAPDVASAESYRQAAVERTSELALECLSYGKQLKAATKVVYICGGTVLKFVFRLRLQKISTPYSHI